jgi:hypothetical protein
MKKADVKINATYVVKVANNLVPVKIVREHANGGWEGESLKTGKTIRIKTAQRLRAPAPKSRPLALATNVAADKPAETPAPKPARATKNADPKPKRVSALDAAVEVLKRRDEPMTCKAMIDAMGEAKLWRTDAATPANTLYSAILREIQRKGDASRFVKIDRGRFAVNAEVA